MSVVHPLFCENCGAANMLQDSTCGFCGQPLVEGVEVANYDDESGGLLVGALLKGRYRIVKPIGHGGMGKVYQAQDLALNKRPVAVKELLLSELSSADATTAIEAFKREAELLAGLQHPNLPALFDHFAENERQYTVMSFLLGETLEAYLERTRHQKLSLKEVLQIGEQLCSVLHYLHSQYPPIIFRDVKPANIMRATDGHIYLIDFGVARHFKPGQKKDTVPFGSVGYAPPEQFGTAQTSPRSDIYSLGATMYELLSGVEPGTSPLHFPPLNTLERRVPEKLSTLIEHMLDRDEQQRPATMLTVQQTLQEISASTASDKSDTATSQPHTLTKKQQKSLLRTGLIFLAICSLLIGGVIGNGIGARSDLTPDNLYGTATALNATEQAINTTATVRHTNLPDPYPPQGTLALVDPLNQPDAWQPQSGGDTEGMCQFTHRKLEIDQADPTEPYVCSEPNSYQNSAIEVKMTIVAGNCGGIALRNTTANGDDFGDDQEFYFFAVCADGHYAFYRISTDNLEQPLTLLTRKNTPVAFKPMGQTNTLAIVADNNTFDLYANHKKIDSIKDNNLKDSDPLNVGTVGLAAYASADNTEILYQDLRIWEIPT